MKRKAKKTIWPKKRKPIVRTKLDLESTMSAAGAVAGLKAARAVNAIDNGITAVSRVAKRGLGIGAKFIRNAYHNFQANLAK